MNKKMRLFALVLALGTMLSVCANAADYTFDDSDEDDGYYQSTSYEDVYGSQYNYGGTNVVDYQGQELEYGQFSTTQTGVMERMPLPGLQEYVGGEANGGAAPAMGTAEGVAPELPDTQPTAQNDSSITVTSKPVCTQLTESFRLENGAVGYISIPAIGVNKYYAWEGETTESMKKGLGHFTGTSVWDGNCCFCGHNRGAKYVIGTSCRLIDTDNIGHYGCGPASMAIEVSSLTSDMVDPAQMAKWAYEHGFWCSKSGSYRSLIPGAAKAWGLNVEGCGKNEAQRIVDALSEGKLVVAIMSKGHFTEHGHFIVLRGVKDGKIMVADPASRSRSGQLWELSLIVKEASSNTSDGGPFWIIGRQ